MIAHSLLLALHLLGVVVWVGGMVFAHFFLRPALEVLAPPERPKLMLAVLTRFFGAVAVAALAVLLTGWALVSRALQAGAAAATLPVSWWFMAAVGTVMVLIFGFIRFALFPRFRAAMARGPGPEVAAALALIRRWVGINLVLGLAVLLVAAARPHG